MPRALRLTILPGRLAVVSLGPGEPVPPWAARPGAPFASITRTADELSIVCPESDAPPGCRCQRGFRALKLLGPFALDEVGILASAAAPLAEAGVAVFAQATYETDYILISEEQLEIAVAVLDAAGHRVERAAEPDLLFAYGTLGPAPGDPPGLWQPDAVRGRLFDLGPYPALVDLDDPSTGWAEGHVRPVGPAELAGMDDYEGLAEGLYRRETARTRAGRVAWVYVYARPLPPGARGPLPRWGRRPS